MAEEFEDKVVPGFDVRHYWGVMRRRHIHFLLALFIGWAIVWGASWVLPARYRSTTLILVEQPTMPKDYVTPNVNDDLQERLQSITQQILSRTRLLHIIDQLNLYANQRASLTPDDKVELMRKEIEIELVRDPQNRVSAFNVSYSAHDPRVAQQVTSEVTNLFINENLEVRQQQSEDTTKFLGDQLEEARKSLADQEEKVRLFKAQHVGEMPAQLATNLQILSGLQSQLQNEEDALNSARQQHVYLQTLADQYRATQGSTGGGDDSSAGLVALDQELDKLKAQLADLTSRYTDRHPDVRKLKEEIAKTEKMRTQLLANVKTTNPAPNGGADSQAPASQSVEVTQGSLLAQIRSQLQSNQVEITNREHSIAALKAKVEEYQSRLNQEPVREQQLADLTRGYDQSKANYDELLKKKNESAMATNMELLQQGERFRIVDRPSFPQKPDFPNRLMFCGFGLGAGLLLGVVVVLAFEELDHRVYDEKELKDLLPIPVIAEIPEVIGPADKRRQRQRAWLTWATTGLVVCSILAGSAFSYLRG